MAAKLQIQKIVHNKLQVQIINLLMAWQHMSRRVMDANSHIEFN